MDYWQGRLVRLRAVEPTDGAFFHASLADAAIQRQTSDIRLPMSQKACDEWVQAEAIKENDRFDRCLIIQDIAGDKAGMIDVVRVDRRVGVFSYGIWIKPEFQRRGYAHEAINILMRFFFLEQGFQKCNATVYSYNEPSIGLHSKLGMKQEGVIRRTVYADGVYYDEIIYGITREEFLSGIGRGSRR